MLREAACCLVERGSSYLPASVRYQPATTDATFTCVVLCTLSLGARLPVLSGVEHAGADPDAPNSILAGDALLTLLRQFTALPIPPKWI